MFIGMLNPNGVPALVNDMGPKLENIVYIKNVRL